MEKRILLVEDDYDINQLIESQLKQDHYSVASTRDGEEALALFQKRNSI